jgi:effector-binding domain-containing protein
MVEPASEEDAMEPRIEERAARPYAGVTRAVTMTTFDQVADRIPEIIGWLAGRGAAPAGAPFLRYHVIDMDRRLEVEAGVPVAAPVEADGEIRPGVLPAGRYLTADHTGHPDELVQVTAGLLDWAEREGLAFDVADDPEGQRWGCRLETFLTNPMEVPDPSKWETQLAFRLAG